MRKGKVYYKDYFAGIISESNEGEYIFQYDPQYVKDHTNAFISFTLPVPTNLYYSNTNSFT